MRSFVRITMVTMLCLSFFTNGHCEEPTPGNSESSAKQSDSSATLSVEQARQQADSMHDYIHNLLHSIHHHYFKEDEGLVIPAAVFTELFADLEEEHPVKLRWLVVEGQAMNADHIARDQFERDAVTALKTKKKTFERVENGIYKHAAAITLTSQCLKCHVPDRQDVNNRTAGLIIAIPVTDK